MMLDFIVTQTNKPNTPIIYSDRVACSNGSQRRIWLGLKSIIYNTDFGIIFEDKDTVSFFQLMQYRIDFNVRTAKELNSGFTPFLAISIQNDKITTLYSRSYMKIQDLLANLGGLTKAIFIIAELLMYLFGSKIPMLKIINAIPQLSIFKNEYHSLVLNNMHKKEDNDKSNIDDLVLNLNKKVNVDGSTIKINNLPQSNKIKQEKLSFSYKNVSLNNINKKLKFKLKLSFLERYLICYSGNSKNSKLFEKGSLLIYSMLNIRNVVSNLIQFQFLKEAVLPEHELEVFDCLFSNKNLNAKDENILLKIKAYQESIENMNTNSALFISKKIQFLAKDE